MSDDGLILCSEFATLCGVSREAIKKAKNSGKLDIVKRGDRWKVKSNGAKSVEYYQLQITKALDRGDDNVDSETPYDLENVDVRFASKADIDKWGALEKALKTKDERLQKRRILIERKLVQTVLGKLYAVDKNEFLTMAAKLSPDVATIAGANDPEILLKIEERIENEAYKVLAHVQRIMNDFLEGVGGGTID